MSRATSVVTSAAATLAACVASSTTATLAAYVASSAVATAATSDCTPAPAPCAAPARFSGAELVDWLHAPETSLGLLLALIAIAAVVLINGRRAREMAQILDAHEAQAWILDGEGRVLRHNRAAREVSGLAHAEVRGRRFSELPLPFAQRERWHRDNLAVLASGKPRYDVVEEFADDTGPRWICIDRVPLAGPRGVTRRMLVILRDISELKRAEAGIRDREAREGALFRAIPDVIWFKDVDGRYRMVNDAFANRLGRPVDEIVGRTADEVLEPGLARQMKIEDDAIIASGQPTHAEESYERDDGSTAWIEIIKVPVLDAGGAVIGIAGAARNVTARKAAEATLHESNARNVALLQANPDSMFVMTRDGVFVDYSNHDPGQLLLPPEQFLGRRVADVMPPPIATQVTDAIAKTLATGATERVEYRLEIGGEARHFEARLVPCGADQVLSIVRDISERKRIEEALSKQNAMLRTQQEASIDGILVVDEHGQIVTHNRRFAELWHLSDDVLRSRSDERALAAVLQQLQQPEEFIARVRHLYEHRAEESRDEIQLRDGRTFDRFSAPMFGDDGSHYGRVWYFRDISERKRAERELQNTKAFLESIVENMPTMLMIKDCDTLRFERFNRACEEATGWAREELVGKTDYDFMPKDKADRITAEDAAIMRAGVLHEMPVETIRTKTGETRHFHTKKIPIPDADGHPRYLLGISADITDHKRTVESLAAANEQLARKATELTDANNELEAFAYSVSHDLRAPLRHIVGYLELLRERLGDSLDAESRRFVERVTAAATKMSRLIDDLLAVARISRAEIQSAPVDLSQLVRDAVHELEPVTFGRTIDWSIAPLPVVIGDRVLLGQALYNLLENAVKYTRPRPAATIAVALQSHGDRELVITIRDNGVGFDMAHAGKLFGVFQRLHSATDFEGTGVGLAIVARAIERHGGKVRIESAVDAGTTVYVTLPATAPAPKPAAVPATPSTALR